MTHFDKQHPGYTDDARASQRIETNEKVEAANQSGELAELSGRELEQAHPGYIPAEQLDEDMLLGIY
jgi:hypothetical protein